MTHGNGVRTAPAPAVRVGVGVFVLKQGRFLMLRRQGSHGAGTWALPGGGVEFGESFEETTRREVAEETGLEVTNVRFVAVTNDVFAAEGKHYVTIWTACDYADGAERIMEPDKSTAMGWQTLDDLPAPLLSCWDELRRSEFWPTVQRMMASV